MNDLATNITPSIKLFATTVFFTVRLIPLAIMLLSTARPRSTREVGLDMAEEICSYKMFVLSITLKISLSQFSFLLCNAQLDGACHQKYFGIYMTCTLSWQLQCDEAKRKAMRVLGILQRNLSLCGRSVEERSYPSLFSASESDSSPVVSKLSLLINYLLGKRLGYAPF